MIILSIDSGLERTGFAIFDKLDDQAGEFKYISSGLIKTSSKKTTSERILELYNELYQVVNSTNPHVIVIEQLFFFKNQKTIVPVSQAQGIILLIAAQKNITAEFLTPLQIKSIVTGYGQSDKKSVQKMLKLTLHLDREIKQDDQADAIACGLAYCYLNKNLI